MSAHRYVTDTKAEGLVSCDNKGADEIFLCEHVRTNLWSPLREVDL